MLVVVVLFVTNVGAGIALCTEPITKLVSLPGTQFIARFAQGGTSDEGQRTEPTHPPWYRFFLFAKQCSHWLGGQLNPVET